MPKIVLLNGPDQGKVFPLEGGSVSIGREPSRGIPLGDSAVADLHAEIRLEREGRFLLRDLGSDTGTLLNGVAIEEHALAVGDEIRIGDTVLLFTDGEPPQVRPAGEPVFSESDAAPSKTYEMSVTPDRIDFIKTEEKDPRRIRSSHRKLSTLYQISQVINSIRDMPALLQRTIDLLVEAVRADRGCILVENEKGELVPEATREPEGVTGGRMQVSRTMAMEALREGKATLTSDAATDARYEGTRSVSAHKIRSAMCVPLRSPGGTFGVVSVHRTAPFSPFVEEDLEFLIVMCNQAAICIENARLLAGLQRTNRLLLTAKDEIVRWTRQLEVKVEERTAQLRAKSEQLKLLSITDGMTGLFNHQHFQNELRKEVNRMKRYREGGEGRTFALAMMDLDGLKVLNDSLGHLAGDAVLKTVAGILRDNLRSVDLPARYGGDEFAILLPETGPDGAIAAMEKLVQRVRECEITYGGLLGETTPEQIREIEGRLGKPLDRSERIPITVSVGLTIYQPSQGPREVIQQADEALYRAKRAGRDRVEIS